MQNQLASWALVIFVAAIGSLCVWNSYAISRQSAATLSSLKTAQSALEYQQSYEFERRVSDGAIREYLRADIAWIDIDLADVEQVIFVYILFREHIDRILERDETKTLRAAIEEFVAENLAGEQ